MEPGVVPPGFCGARRLVLQGAWAVKEGFVSRNPAGDRLGDQPRTHGPGICGDGFPLSEVVGRANGHIKTENMIGPLIYNPKKHLR